MHLQYVSSSGQMLHEHVICWVHVYCLFVYTGSLASSRLPVHMLFILGITECFKPPACQLLMQL